MPCVIFSQESVEEKTKRLEQQLNMTAGKKSIEILNDLAALYYKRAPKRAVSYCLRAIKSAEELEAPREKARAQVLIANAYRALGEIKKPFQYAREALDTYSQLQDKSGTISAQHTLGYLYLSIDNYQESQKYLLRALRLCEEIKDLRKKSGILYKLGSMNNRLNQPEDALKCFQEALEIAEKRKDLSLIAFILNNIGTSYQSLGKNERALDYYNRSLAIFMQLKVLHGITAVYGNMGICYGHMGDTAKSLQFLFNAVAKAEEVGNRSQVCNNTIYIAGQYLKMKQYKKAEDYYRKALSIAEAIEGKDSIEAANKQLSRLFAAIGDYKQALEFYKRASQMKDQLVNETKNKQIAELQVRYESQKRAREIDSLKTENRIQILTRNTLLAGLALLLVFLVLLVKKYLYLFTFWKKQKYIANYRLTEMVGSGGMSNIYKAHGVRDKNNIVAVKVLRDELVKGETHRKRFKQEATIIDKLKHPNIIQIFERGDYNEKLYIVMEFLEGITLAQKLEKNISIPHQQCFNIMKQITDAVAFIHGKHIMHRDLKPANIMLIKKDGRDGFVKLLDFGLSRMKFQSQLTRTGILVGTVHYMPPEQISDLHYSIAGDIYALGIIFYEIVTGGKAFKGSTFSQVEIEIIKNTLMEPISIRSDIPPQLNRLIMQMVSKDPFIRPSAEDVAYQLEELATSL
ncbi:MAG: protein kinase [bacterium]|nr:protein kinase [bacterium]